MPCMGVGISLAQMVYTKNRRNALQQKPVTVYTTNRGDMLVTAEHQQRDCFNAAKAHGGLYNDKWKVYKNLDTHGESTLH